MKKSAVLYLFFSFLSALGDTVFLFGIPLYLYNENGKQLSYSALVPFIIIFTIFAFKKFIFKVNHLNPLFLVSTGELVMGAIELVLLFLLVLFKQSSLLILLMLIPLALTYNIYSASKRLKIQDYFFSDNKVFLNGIHSTLDRIGRLLGVFLAGYILEHFNISGLILFDALTFFSFGLFVLIFYCSKKNDCVATVTSIEDKEKDVIPNSYSQVKTIFILLIVLNLFLAWENSSFVPSFQREGNYDLFNLVQIKAGLNLIGLILGLVALKFFLQKITLFLYGLSFTFLLSVSFFSGIELFCLLSVFVGFMSILLVSFQRGLIKRIAAHGKSLSEVATSFWYFQVVTSFSILPINFLSDTYGFFQSSNILIFSYLAIGLIIGYSISTIYLERISYEA